MQRGLSKLLIRDNRNVSTRACQVALKIALQELQVTLSIIPVNLITANTSTLHAGPFFLQHLAVGLKDARDVLWPFGRNRLSFRVPASRQAIFLLLFLSLSFCVYIFFSLGPTRVS